MNLSTRITGVLSPVVTPFKTDLSPDSPLEKSGVQISIKKGK